MRYRLYVTYYKVTGKGIQNKLCEKCYPDVAENEMKKFMRSFINANNIIIVSINVKINIGVENAE